MGLHIVQPDNQVLTLFPFEKREELAYTVQLWCDVRSNTHNLQWAPHIKKKRDQRFMVEFSPGEFKNIARTIKGTLHEFTRGFNTQRPVVFFPGSLSIDAVMHRCISSITHHAVNDALKNLFLYARIVELVWLQQQQHKKSKTVQPVFIKSEYDKERILFARDYLLTHMDAPPTLTQLAVIAGINEFKLKRGFKEMFNQTVFAYLADVRLEMASRALLEKQKSITRIAFELGYASLQHFSTAFKKKFGVAPVKYG
ncbi:MAG TPA: AraC family transcriptional regulator [Flavobacteriales bacterium]|nr:AraC family transcriptional regulator [Flavobacteriales bacterium]